MASLIASTCPSDLTDEEWSPLAPLLSRAKSGGRPWSIDLRRITDGLFYLAHSRRARHYLPRDYGPWFTDCHFFRGCLNDERWELLHASPRMNHSAPKLDDRSSQTSAHRWG